MRPIKRCLDPRLRGDDEGSDMQMKTTLTRFVPHERVISSIFLDHASTSDVFLAGIEQDSEC